MFHATGGALLGISSRTNGCPGTRIAWAMRLIVHELISFVLEVFSRLCFALFLLAKQQDCFLCVIVLGSFLHIRSVSFIGLHFFHPPSLSSLSSSEPKCVRKSQHNITCGRAPILASNSLRVFCFFLAQFVCSAGFPHFAASVSSKTLTWSSFLVAATSSSFACKDPTPLSCPRPNESRDLPAKNEFLKLTLACSDLGIEHAQLSPPPSPPIIVNTASWAEDRGAPQYNQFVFCGVANLVLHGARRTQSLCCSLAFFFSYWSHGERKSSFVFLGILSYTPEPHIAFCPILGPPTFPPYLTPPYSKMGHFWPSSPLDLPKCQTIVIRVCVKASPFTQTRHKRTFGVSAGRPAGGPKVRRRFTREGLWGFIGRGVVALSLHPSLLLPLLQTSLQTFNQPPSPSLHPFFTPLPFGPPPPLRTLSLSLSICPLSPSGRGLRGREREGSRGGGGGGSGSGVREGVLRERGGVSRRRGFGREGGGLQGGPRVVSWKHKGTAPRENSTKGKQHQRVNSTKGETAPKEKQHQRETAPKGNSTKGEQHQRGTAPKGNSTKGEHHQRGTAPKGNSTKGEQHQRGTAPKVNSTKGEQHQR